MSILQGRFEAISQAAPQVEPGHLALGVLKRLAPEFRSELFPEASGFDRFCAQLRSTPVRAAVSPKEIEYSTGSHALVAAAAALSGLNPSESGVEPLHLLAAAYEVDGEDRELPLLLHRHGLTRDRLLQLLTRDPPPLP